MKRLLPLVALTAIALTAASASAQLNLSWNDCGSGGVADKAFACGANTGANLFYGSFIAPAGTTAITGAEGVIDMISATGTLPAWWEFTQAGACRLTAMSVQYNTPCTSAVDYWGSIPGGPLGGFGYFYGSSLNVGENGPSYQPRTDAARWKTVSAVDGSAATAVTAGDEVYAFTVRITNALTTGTGACAGCSTPVCVVFNSIKLTQPVGVGDYLLSGAAPSGRDFVTWQGGAGANCATVPVKASSWGQIKSLYR